MAYEFVAKNGLISKGNVYVTSSVIAQSFTGSLYGTSSLATTSSYTPTSSYTKNSETSSIARSLVAITGSTRTWQIYNEEGYGLVFKFV